MPPVRLLPLDAADWERVAISPQDFAREKRLTSPAPDDLLQVVALQSAALQSRSSAPSPFGGFLSIDVATREIVGTCGFKAPPDESGAVEIAYFTFPGFERRGYATEMAAQLVDVARQSDGVRLIRAHTLPESNASTRILSKLGFEHVGGLIDPEDGAIWRWERATTLRRMRYTLWSGAVQLGDVTIVRDMAGPGQLAGIFQPAPACSEIGAPLLQVARDGMQLAMESAKSMPAKDELAALPAEERGHRIRDAMLANPASRRLTELLSAVKALALELRDEGGKPVAATNLGVMRITVPGQPDEVVQREMAEGLELESAEFMFTANFG